MTIERTTQGAWRVFSIHEGHLVTRVYYGYTKRQALSMFRHEVTS